MSSTTPFDSSALIPWYLNGTLATEERRAVESWLVASGSDVELQMWRAVQQQVRIDRAVEPGTELGWRRLRGQLGIAQEATRPAWKWRAALAAGILAIASFQTLILLRQETVHLPLSGTTVASPDAWRLQVRFAERATIRDINALLLRIDAHIANGPSALGVYEISIPRTAATNVDDLLQELRREPLIEQVTLPP
ncbi:MAG TPA: hypothetical protein VK624_05590 [Steroidobacteraceae bacterium]|nr:hypothetical protein [Steroidobacteraceae bacterium]